MEQEGIPDGYKIVLHDDGSRFGLASTGFAHDRVPVLAGWYGGLLTTLLSLDRPLTGTGPGHLRVSALLIGSGKRLYL